MNIDERQMLLMEGDTAAEVEGLDSNTGKCTVFENRRIMKYYLFNRVELEKEYKKQKVEHNNNKEKEESLRSRNEECVRSQREECVRSVLDQETNNYVDNRMFEHMKAWIDWFGFKSNRIKMNQHQIKLKNENEIEQQWQQEILAGANRLAEKTGLKIEDCLAEANKVAEAIRRPNIK